MGGLPSTKSWLADRTSEEFYEKYLKKTFPFLSLLHELEVHTKYKCSHSVGRNVFWDPMFPLYFILINPVSWMDLASHS